MTDNKISKTFMNKNHDTYKVSIEVKGSKIYYIIKDLGYAKIICLDITTRNFRIYSFNAGYSHIYVGNLDTVNSMVQQYEGDIRTWMAYPTPHEFDAWNIEDGIQTRYSKFSDMGKKQLDSYTQDTVNSFIQKSPQAVLDTYVDHTNCEWCRKLQEHPPVYNTREKFAAKN